jgi:hypothetical protein
MQGGTSTGVSRFEKSFEHVFDTTISGATITAPMLDLRPSLRVVDQFHFGEVSSLSLVPR